MKRSPWVLTVLVILFLVSSCGGEKATATPESPEALVFLRAVLFDDIGTATALLCPAKQDDLGAFTNLVARFKYELGLPMCNRHCFEKAKEKGITNKTAPESGVTVCCLQGKTQSSVGSGYFFHKAEVAYIVFRMKEGKICDWIVESYVEKWSEPDPEGFTIIETVVETAPEP